jgi:hypothetical protein
MYGLVWKILLLIKSWRSCLVKWIPHECAKSNNSKLYNSKFFLSSTGQPRPSTPEGVHTDATVRLVEVESLWLLVALDCQCIFRQALLYLESNDAVESAELVVGDYLESNIREERIMT